MTIPKRKGLASFFSNSSQDTKREKIQHNDATDSISIYCPICSIDLCLYDEPSRNHHVESCLDLSLSADKTEETLSLRGNDQLVNVKTESSASISISNNDSTFSESTEISALDGAFIPKPETEDYPINEDPDDKKVVISAFSKILQANHEEEKWKSTAKEQKSQHGMYAARRSCPFYKIMPSPIPFTVDAFKYGLIPDCKAYFLSHFHSDHYGGLHKSWDHGNIVCSKVTGNLVIQQLRVDPKYVITLPFNCSTQIEGVTVTLIEANHCPGSALFLFETPQTRVLHCGDFRACPAHVQNPLISKSKLNYVYLDTTYLNPKYAFPSQDQVVSACAQVAKSIAYSKSLPSRPGSISQFLVTKQELEMAPTYSTLDPTTLLIVVGTYSIGKEKIALACAKALNTKIYASASKMRLLKCLEDETLTSLLTSKPDEAQVHMTFLNEIRADTLRDYLHSVNKSGNGSKKFTRVIGFRGTGWTYSPPKSRSLHSPSVQFILENWNLPFQTSQIKPARGSTRDSMCFNIPYSEHSSFRDLMCFCMALDIDKIIPTVNVGSANSRQLMRRWLDRWQHEKERSGRIKFPDDAISF